MQQPYLLDRAKHLRSTSTPFEVRLWTCLSRSQMNGHKFRRQHVIGNCIVDFFCPQKGLIVEVDGDTHDAAKDEIRDAVHAQAGYATIRFSNADVGKDLSAVLQSILATLESLPDRWPHPSIPSPEGEGKL